MPYRVRIRKFLNKPGFYAGAYVLAEVEDSTKHKKGKHGWPYVHLDLTLADCSRVVSFDFDLSSARQRANSLRKIHILVDTLIQFRDALQAEADLAADRSRGKEAGHGGTGRSLRIRGRLPQLARFLSVSYGPTGRPLVFKTSTSARVERNPVAGALAASGRYSDRR